MLFILAWVFWLYHNRKAGKRENGYLRAHDSELEGSHLNHEFSQRLKIRYKDGIHLYQNGDQMSDNSVRYRHCRGSAWPISINGNFPDGEAYEDILPVIEMPVESVQIENDLERMNDVIFQNTSHGIAPVDDQRLVEETSIFSTQQYGDDEMRLLEQYGDNEIKLLDESYTANGTTINDVDSLISISTQTPVNSNLSVSLTQPHRHTQLSVNVVDTFVTSPLSSPTRQHYKSEIKLIPSPNFQRKSFRLSTTDEEIAEIFHSSNESRENTDEMKYTTKHGVNVLVEAEPIGRIHSIVVRPEGRSPIRSLHQSDDEEDYDEDNVHLIVKKEKPGNIHAINVRTQSRKEEFVEDEICAYEEGFEENAPDFTDEEEYFSDDVIDDVHKHQTNDFDDKSDVSLEENVAPKNPFAQYVDKQESDNEILETFNDTRPITPNPVLTNEKSTSSEDDKQMKKESKLFNKLKSLQKKENIEDKTDTKTHVKKEDDAPSIKPSKTTIVTQSKKQATPVNQSKAETKVLEQPKESLVKPRPTKPSFTVKQKSDSDDFMSIMQRRKKYVDTMDDAGRLLGQIANRDVKIHGRPTLSKNWRLLKECVRTKRYLLFKDKPMKLVEPYRRQSAGSKPSSLYGKHRI